MYLAHLVSECDFSGRKYAEPVMGAHCLAQGATGRWCWVLCVGPEALAEGGIVPLSYDDAVSAILREYPGSTIDF